MQHKPLFAAAAALTALVAGSAQAAPVAITNASFEDFDVSSETDVTATNLPGWTEANPDGLVLRIWDNAAAPASQQQTNVDGQQWVGITTGNTGTTPTTLTQTLGATVAANTTYTLTAAFSTFTRISTTGGDFVQAQLIADLGGSNETVLADTGEIGAGDFVTQNVFTDYQGVGDSTGANAALVGESLSIVISLLHTDNVNKVSADNIRLDATLIPEPGSLALMALGGMCVLRRRRS